METHLSVYIKKNLAYVTLYIFLVAILLGIVGATLNHKNIYSASNINAPTTMAATEYIGPNGYIWSGRNTQ